MLSTLFSSVTDYPINEQSASATDIQRDQIDIHGVQCVIKGNIDTKTGECKRHNLRMLKMSDDDTFLRPTDERHEPIQQNRDFIENPVRICAFAIDYTMLLMSLDHFYFE